ncbi:tricyclene synthase TPS4, chloroplastic-like [Neltuma alba]|uniref:tricyclene synthase TPS4, chloroplastic-like n=1 Tax=Neltuma alba TaxID=207710 RepID=UPI0010A2C134|nr:tricyclene synthase TPS4, chloroplastic-like [Prosopis alba]
MALASAFLPGSSPISFSFRENNKPGGSLSFHRIGHSHNNLRCLATQQTLSLPPSSLRNSANYQPTLWNYDFLQSLNNGYTDEKYEARERKLLEDVGRMIVNPNTEPLPKLELIDDVQRLGLGYRFHNEIKHALDCYVSWEQSRPQTKQHTSLHAAALSFRLLRDHGYDVSPDIFESFKDQNCNFKACLSRDVQGMLSLYEATFLGYQGEDILEEAKAFTTIHLRDMRQQISNDHLLQQAISHALDLPLHRRTRRLEARWYIEAYGKRKNADTVLLEAAVLDFNIAQSTLQRDLQEMSRWWKAMGLASKLSFSRDRLMECFFWAVGMASEPQHSELRKALTKVACFVTTIDDVYDVYGTLDELELFTAAVERWDINAMQDLPGYMKVCFLALYNTVNEMAYEALKEQGHNILPYLTKAWADMLKSWLQEARWSHDKHIPSFDSYFRNAWVSVSGVLILFHAYFFLNHSFSKESLQSLDPHHPLLRCPSVIFRLCNDLGTSKAELERGESTSSILCHMHQSGATEENSQKYVRRLVDETWKEMNKGRGIETTFSKAFVETAMSLARISHCTYQYGDGHGDPDATSRNRIRSLIVEPIQLRG